MRVIFLDFDGVLHDAAAARALPNCPVAEVRARLPRTFVHAGLLAQVLADAPDVRIVITSRWALAYTLPELVRLVPELAPWLGGSLEAGERVAMIRNWVDAHAVRSFVVLDDEPDRFAAGHWPQLVVCNPVLGLADPRVVQALMRWLQVRPAERALSS